MVALHAATSGRPLNFSLATWNINSVRLRIETVARFLREQKPDVLCLQETKCPDGQFPSGEFHKLGYEHIALNGQKGYHGVAIVSRHLRKGRFPPYLGDLGRRRGGARHS